MADSTPKIPPPPPGFQFRRYENQDWADYIELDVTNRMEERGLDASKKDYFRALRLRRLERAYGFTPNSPPNHPPHQILVLRHESGSYGGHVWMTDHTDPLTEEAMVHVTSIAIVPQHRRKGLARYLLAVGEVLARMRKVPELRVDVGVDNRPAIRLFEKSGLIVRAQRMAKDLR